MSTLFPPPDPRAKPVPADDLIRDAEFVDDGPVLDVSASEIEIERGNAGVTPDSKPGAPPEAELPPD